MNCAVTDLSCFEPEHATARDLRDAFGRFPTGVTVITVATPQGPVAITANSFSSLSLDPPLVLWSPEKASRRFEYFDTAQHFAIHVLAADQEGLCWRVARDMHALSGEELSHNPEGVPVLRDCLARFECRHWASYDGGDHTIIVGRVLRVGMQRDREALSFFAGRMMPTGGAGEAASHGA